MSATIVNSILPVVLLILLGYLMKNHFGFSDGFWRPLERLVYYALFPSVLFLAISTSKWDDLNLSSYVFSFIFCLLIGSAGALVLSHLICKERHSVSSCFQGCMRINGFIALPICQLLYGVKGLQIVSISMLTGVLFLNISSVCVLLYYSQTDLTLRKTIKTIIINPLMISCSLGLVFSLLHIPLPQIAQQSLELISGSALPLGLMAIGSSFRPSLNNCLNWPVLSSSVFKLLLLPFLLLALMIALGVTDAIVISTGMILISMPTATSSYVLARQLGGDTEMMASIISTQLILALLTIPVIMSISLHPAVLTAIQ